MSSWVEATSSSLTFLQAKAQYFVHSPSLSFRKMTFALWEEWKPQQLEVSQCHMALAGDDCLNPFRCDNSYLSLWPLCQSQGGSLCTTACGYWYLHPSVPCPHLLFIYLFFWMILSPAFFPAFLSSSNKGNGNSYYTGYHALAMDTIPPSKNLFSNTTCSSLKAALGLEISQCRVDLEGQQPTQGFPRRPRYNLLKFLVQPLLLHKGNKNTLSSFAASFLILLKGDKETSHSLLKSGWICPCPSLLIPGMVFMLVLIFQMPQSWMENDLSAT